MAEALIRGMTRTSPHGGASMGVSDPSAARCDTLRSTYGVQVTADNLAVARSARTLVLAVKPQRLTDVLRELGPALQPGQCVVSIVAGVTIESIARSIHAPVSVIRAMPNTPCLVGEGMTGLVPAAHTNAEQMASARALFGAVGKVVVFTTEQEPLLDIVTAISGSGPAYMFLMIEALRDAGAALGLPREVAAQLATQTMLGSALLAQQSGVEPETLRNNVTSPQGTTHAALGVLEQQHAFRTLVAGAVERATLRARELSLAWDDTSSARDANSG
jgi:pyrroline-5-carboxylate reductase